MSYSWFRSGTCTVANGSDVVRFQNAQLTTSPTKPVEGDAFTIDGTKFYETIFIGSDSAGEYIKLQQPYSGASASNAKYAIARFASGTQNAKLVAMATAAINQKQISLDDMEEWFTSTSDTVDFSNPDGSISTITTYHKLTKEISAVGGSSAEISTVAANIASITNVSGNMTAVIDAKPQADRSKLEADRAEEAADRAEAAENTVIAQGNTQVSRVLSEGNTQVGLVVSSGDQQVSRVISEGGSQVALATAQADRAKDEADKASISASSIYGMSQAQFEAIRQQNKDEFAASGFVHFGKHTKWPPTATPINEGLWNYIDVITTSKLFIGRVSTNAKEGKSKNDSASINVAGVIFDLSVNPYGEWDVRFPQAPDGKTTYNKATGVVTAHATVTAAFNAQAADPTNVEVVTDRVDMWGFEAFLEEVNTTNPYVYPNGLIQSQAATMDGISTSASARPVTYYAVFDGDTGSKGKGLNFFTLTDAQKKKVLGNHKNNLYYLDDGRLVQWRLRQRTIAGAGNGDWEKIDSMMGDSLKVNSKLNITAQGQLDYRAPYVLYEVGANSYRSSVNALNYKKNIGVYTVLYTSNDAAVNGECYFLVCGTVNRLNQGAYHPSFNPSGAGVLSQFGSSVWQWHQLPNHITSTLSCFIPATASSIGSRGGSISEGNVLSGRPDRRYYDSIYASGQGGVCRDMRYSAYGVEAVDFAEADQRVKNGMYRGFEKLLFNKVTQAVALTSSTPLSSKDAYVSNAAEWRGGDRISLYDTVTGEVIWDKEVVTAAGDNFVFCANAPAYTRNAGVVYASIQEKDLLSSVGGSFLQTDVIGNPANILATPALANGWQGSWLPWIPNNTASPSQVRKALKDMGQVYSDNNGASWLSSPWGLNGVTNSESTGGAVPSNMVVLRYYQAFAKQTENAVNTPVYGGDAGVGKVYAVNGYSAIDWSVLLMESLTGLIAKSTASGVLRNYVPLSDVGFEMQSGKLRSDGFDATTHTPLTLSQPANNSAGFKVLNHKVNVNQQANIQYAYTQLKHNGTNWGDDGKVTIVDNQSTKTDLNGNTVLVGTAKLKEPIGWIKNKV